MLLLAIAARGATPERGQLDASPTLFTVMAALNAAGYDAEVDSPNNSVLRDAARKYIAGRKLSCLADLKAYFAAHPGPGGPADLSPYISFALTAGDPPEFAIKIRSVEIPQDVTQLQDLAPLLTRFYYEAGIEDLWARSQPVIERMLEAYHEPVAQTVLQVNSYLRQTTSGFKGRRFQIYVDLLAAPNQVHTRSYGDNYYVVATPAPQPQIDQIRHAYLHYLLDPLATRYSEILMRKRGLADHAQRAPALAESYKSDFLLLATESLIKAVESRLDKKPAAIEQALREGFVLAPYFAEQLPVYEKEQQAMLLYFPEMVKAIDLKREDARLSKAEFVASVPVKTVKVSAPERPPEPVGVAKTLEEAEQLYTSRDLDKAKQTYLRSLQETDQKPLHAKAYYGLARIAVLQKDPESATQLFQKTLDSSPEPQIRAWTLVYLGRLSDASGDREQATRHYQSALAVEGGSVAARRAAEQGLKQSFQK